MKAYMAISETVRCGRSELWVKLVMIDAHDVHCVKDRGWYA